MSGTIDAGSSCLSMTGSASGGVSFASVGIVIVFSGAYTASGTIMANPAAGESCASGTKRLTLVLAEDGGVVPTTSSTTSTTIPVPPLGGGPASNSTGCLGTPLHETSTPVYTKLATYNFDATTTYVCVRVADTPTGNGYGGRLEITTGGGGLPNPGVPTTDTDSDECGVAPNNSAPPPRPLLKGQTAGVAYEVGIYQGPGMSGNGEVWVCLQAGSAQHRVKVPTGGLSTPGLPNVAWRPDTGTPG